MVHIRNAFVLVQPHDEGTLLACSSAWILKHVGLWGFFSILKLESNSVQLIFISLRVEHEPPGMSTQKESSSKPRNHMTVIFRLHLMPGNKPRICL